MAIDETELLTAFVQDTSKWPGETFCVKQRGRDGRYRAFGNVTKPGLPITVHDAFFAKTAIYDTVTDMINDGWIVD